MRIALVVHQYPPEHVGGTEIYTRNLAVALAESGHQVAVFHPQAAESGDEQRDQDGILIWRAAQRPLPASFHPLGSFWRTLRNRAIEGSFRRFLASFSPEVVHLQHLQNVSVRLVRLAAGRPRLLTLHDYWYICANGQLLRPDGTMCPSPGVGCAACALARLGRPLPRWVEPPISLLFWLRNLYLRRELRGIDRFIAPSRFLLDRYAAAGFPSERMTCLENGIPVQRIRRFARQPSEGQLRVTYVGSIAWQKGVHTLAEACSLLPANAIRLRIWGDPTVFAAYAAQVRDLLPDPASQMMGPIPNAEVGRVLADSDLLVVPSLWYENSPVVIQEARAAGLPVVASRLGALAEKVTDGVDGLTFTPGDARSLSRVLRRCLDDPGLPDRLARNLPPPMEISAHVEALLALYRQALGR
jgi:glycosyltransferase involved in cell wall biosynthesis